jgi:hypothetical protein
VVQDPKDAALPEMLRTALERIEPDHVAHLREMPGLLHALIDQPAGDPIVAPDNLRKSRLHGTGIEHGNDGQAGLALSPGGGQYHVGT